MTYNVPADIAKLKASISASIAQELEAFRAATGLTPSLVSVRFIDTTTAGMATRQHTVAGVDVRFDF